MKMILTPAKTPDEYVEYLDGWQRIKVEELRSIVVDAVPEFEERLKWGHLVYFLNGPVLIIRAEPTRVLFGFFRGKRLREIEPRLKASGKYELATMEFQPETEIAADVAALLARTAAELNRELGDPTDIGPRRKKKEK